jgi:hypothetical protein
MEFTGATVTILPIIQCSSLTTRRTLTDQGRENQRFPDVSLALAHLQDKHAGKQDNKTVKATTCTALKPCSEATAPTIPTRRESIDEFCINQAIAATLSITEQNNCSRSGDTSVRTEHSALTVCQCKSVSRPRGNFIDFLGPTLDRLQRLAALDSNRLKVEFSIVSLLVLHVHRCWHSQHTGPANVRQMVQRKVSRRHFMHSGGLRNKHEWSPSSRAQGCGV